MKLSDLREQWSGKEQKLQFIEIVLFLSLTTLLFYILGTNMMLFGVFVYVGLAWLIYKTPNRKLCFITGIMGGMIGFFTEFWGCSNQIWNWTEPCITIWMIFGHKYGFPIEVVIAYFASGFWMSKVTLILFEPQLQETIEFFDNKEYNDTITARVIVALIIDAIGLTILIIEPMYIQSMLLIMVGTNIFLTLPKNAMVIVAPFAVFMGAMGFFFENFATGIIPGFSVWVYDISLYDNLNIPNPVIGVAPISAFFAYMGTGFVLFSSSFVLNKFIRS